MDLGLQRTTSGLVAAAAEAELSSWAPFFTITGVLAVIVVALVAFGRSGEDGGIVARVLLRPANALERLTRIPGWAAATIGLSLSGLLVAGEGFYSDVAWHIAFGRDEVLFTAPHTSIVVGLGIIMVSSLVGILLASLQRVDTRLRWRAVRVPWSTLPLFALGAAAVSGFPLDEVWHRTYGIDVTMWSPTHMLMILGAALTGLAAWLVLADAGVRPGTSRWSKGVHVFAGWFALQGLVAPLGEFAFGVPQFQHLFHPIVLCIASAFAFVAIRLVLGPWWATGIAAFTFAISEIGLLGGDSDLPAETRQAGSYVAAAVAVEAAARILGTDRRVRFAVAAGLGVGSVGLAGEWWWNQRAHQPWQASLLPEAAILGILAAVGTAVVAAAFARAAAGEQGALEARDGRSLPRWSIGLAAALVVAVMVVPLPRRTGDVTAALEVRRQGPVAGLVVTLTPAAAADEARWFQVTAWQGGGLEISDLVETAPGRWETVREVPVTGRWKTLVRLHRGSELMALPVYLPDDPEIGKTEIPAVDRTQAFEPEGRYLLRETHEGAGWLAPVVYGLLVLAMLAWAGAFALAVGGIAPTGRHGGRPRGGSAGLPLTASTPA